MRSLLQHCFSSLKSKRALFGLLVSAALITSAAGADSINIDWPPDAKLVARVVADYDQTRSECLYEPVIGDVLSAADRLLASNFADDWAILKLESSTLQGRLPDGASALRCQLIGSEVARGVIAAAIYAGQLRTDAVRSAVSRLETTGGIALNTSALGSVGENAATSSLPFGDNSEPSKAPKTPDAVAALINSDDSTADPFAPPAAKPSGQPAPFNAPGAFAGNPPDQGITVAQALDQLEAEATMKASQDRRAAPVSGDPNFTQTVDYLLNADMSQSLEMVGDGSTFVALNDVSANPSDCSFDIASTVVHTSADAPQLDVNTGIDGFTDPSLRQTVSYDLVTHLDLRKVGTWSVRQSKAGDYWLYLDGVDQMLTSTSTAPGQPPEVTSCTSNCAIPLPQATDPDRAGHALEYLYSRFCTRAVMAF